MASETTLLGAAGEYYVLCQLLRRDFIAALAPQGVPNMDIVVTNVQGNRQFAIQVKTKRDIGADKGWHMGRKHESILSPTLYYCFVNFGKDTDDKPLCYIVPSQVVANVLSESHKKWLSTPGKKGQQRRDGDLRRFLPDYRHIFGINDGRYANGWLEQYKESWEQLR